MKVDCWYHHAGGLSTRDEMTAVYGPFNGQINVHSYHQHGALIMCEFGRLILRFDEVDCGRQPEAICDETNHMR